MPPSPRIGVVVVNWFGGDRTIDCLTSLEGLTWPADSLVVTLVDNGSEPGWVDGVRARFPAIRIVETGANLGFGGACNRGFEALRDCDHVALLNNDAIPSPDWLEPLVEVLEGDPQAGAATPKVLLADRYVGLELDSPSARPGAGDTRPLGIQLCGARVDGEDLLHRAHLVSGFWGWERDEVTIGGEFAWTDGHGVVLVPTRTDRARIGVRVACGHGPTKVEVRAGGEELARAAVDHRPTWVEVDDEVRAEDIVNNAGTRLLPDGSTADRGYLQVDGAEFGRPSEVFGWSGAAVLLSRRYLDDLDGFDERYFMYSEDADLSWRGRLRGWRFFYEPRSVVRHEHSATVGDRSALVRHLAARNRLLLLAKCAPRSVAVAQLRRQVAVVASTLARDVLRRPLSGKLPIAGHLTSEARVLAGFLRAGRDVRAARRRLGVDEATRRAVFDRWVS